MVLVRPEFRRVFEASAPSDARLQAFPMDIKPRGVEVDDLQRRVNLGLHRQCPDEGFGIALEAIDWKVLVALGLTAGVAAYTYC
jgi:hypothetical protein